MVKTIKNLNKKKIYKNSKKLNKKYIKNNKSKKIRKIQKGSGYDVSSIIPKSDKELNGLSPLEWVKDNLIPIINIPFLLEKGTWEDIRKSKLDKNMEKLKGERAECIQIDDTNSVLITEKLIGKQSDSVCQLFKNLKPSEIDINVRYNYILYTNDIKNTPKILITQLYNEPEIATKHRCLLQRIKADPIIIASGELVYTDDQNLEYSTVSSLWWEYVLPNLFPFPEYRRGNMKEIRAIRNLLNDKIVSTYEKELVKMWIEKIFPTKNIIYKTSLKKGKIEQLEPTKLCELPHDERKNYCLKKVKTDKCDSFKSCPPIGNGVTDLCK